MGNEWLCRLCATLSEAARTQSYIETTSPTQADSLHKAIKEVDIRTICKGYELLVRKCLSRLRFGRVKVALDTTEDPYWGKKGGSNSRASVDEKSKESWQFLNLAIVEPYFVPLMSLPYRQTDSLDDLVIDLLQYLKYLPIRTDLVLFDRGFYHARLIDYLEARQIPYLIFVPRTDAVKRYFEQSTAILNSFQHEMSYALDKSTWKPETKIVICKGVGKDKLGNPLDWCFATNQKPSLSLVQEYKKRWNIETGFRIHDEAKIKTKSSHLLIRFFYHLLSMLFVLVWRVRRARRNFVLVFKRFLKEIEDDFLKLVAKPPA
ncbi:MAG TPA: transposase [Candidatus Nanoarchaeia archaeon]|nr:transposase [Candidatus Nanoarchaeia archaeon]